MLKLMIDWAPWLTCDMQLVTRTGLLEREKSSEPCLILAGESRNGTSCLNLWTWCQADANLLAGVFLSAVPAPALLSSQFACTFITVVTRCIGPKWLFWLTVQVLVCELSLVETIIIIKDTLVALESEWNMALTAAGIGSVCVCVSVLPDSQHPPWPFRHHRWHPGNGQIPVRTSEWASLDFLFCLGFYLI